VAADASAAVQPKQQKQKQQKQGKQQQKGGGGCQPIEGLVSTFVCALVGSEDANIAQVTG
jgi:hypothetical protein